MDSTNDPFLSDPLLSSDPHETLIPFSGLRDESQLGFPDSALSFDSPDAHPANDDLPELSHQSHTSTGSNSNIIPTGAALQDLAFFESPESTTPDSSSDSSLQRARHCSSHSSQSRFSAGDIAMVDGDQFAAWSATDDVTGLYPSNESNNPLATDFNFPMDKILNFDSAASSPGPHTNSDFMANSPYDHLKMPYRSSPGSVLPFKSSFSHGSIDSTGLNHLPWVSSAPKHPESLPTIQNGNLRMAALNGERLSENKLLDYAQNQAGTYDYSQASQYSSSGASSGFHPLANSVPIANRKPIASSIESAGMDQALPLKPTLSIHSKCTKSRVETQIPVKLALSPFPPGITKLHIPRHSVARATQMAKTTPEKSPGMLELNVDLVCASAMQDPVKRARALSRAAGTPEQESKEDTRRNSGSVPACAANDLEKPSNGGCVVTCGHCMIREQRRADRKKSKKPEQEALWRSLSSKRIVMFNSPEVSEWEDPCAINLYPKKKNKGSKSPGDEPLVQVVGSAASSTFMEVSLPMRIGCYCRHQGEKVGFQVIFTIKDHEDNFVAQAMSESIMITDDHKSHTAPASKVSQNSVPSESMHTFGNGLFQCAAPLTRHAYSTTDLQGLRQASGPGFPYNNFSFPTPPQSYHSPTTLAHQTTPSQGYHSPTTHQNVSRPVSPSAPSERHQKRRKGSASSNLPSSLIMTRMSTDDTPTTPVSDLPSAGPPNGLSPAAATFSSTSYATSNPIHNSLNTTPFRYPSGPPEDPLYGSEARSQSMEDLRGLLQQNVAQNPAHSGQLSSYVASNGSPNYISNVAHSQHQTYTSVQNLQSDERIGSGLTALTPAQRPLQTIHKLIPSEGSKSGGIEVICLGSGFYPSLNVRFGETVASTHCWSESSLVCRLPPASRAGPVAVRLQHDYAQNPTESTGQQLYFTYIDDDEPEIIKQVLTTLVRKFTGRTEDPGEIVRKMRNGTLLGSEPQTGYGTGNGLQGYPAAQHLQASDPNSDPVDLETWLLRCLDLIDLDDSPFPAHLNSTTGHNGQTMLHLGASLGFYRFVSALLARGAHPDSRDKNGMSPMHIASLNNQTRIVRRLRSAGGDPTLRSLRGHTPADMASSKEMHDFIDLLERSSWSQSSRVTPVTNKTRASSVASLRSLWEDRSRTESVDLESVSPDEDNVAVSSDEEGAPSNVSHVAAISQLWIQSRRNSTTEQNIFSKERSPEDPAGNDRFLAAATAWSAWRDQIATQVQQLQQSMHRTLPNLPMPTLPPMPNLPDYQDYPMVRRISSLVPFSPRDSKDTDYHWWELLRGTTAPPPYDELYPHDKQQLSHITEGFALRSAGNTMVDNNCSAGFGRDISANGSLLDTIGIGSQSLTTQQRAELMAAHAMKVKRLQNDRNLLLLWIPLFLLVLMALFNPQLWHGLYYAFTYVRGLYQGLYGRAVV